MIKTVNKKRKRKFLPFLIGLIFGITSSILFCIATSVFSTQGGTSQKSLENYGRLKSLPNDVIPEKPKLPDLDWKAKLSPEHIPTTLQQEINLKREVFVGLLAANEDELDSVLYNYKTWIKELDVNEIDYSIFSPIQNDQIKNSVHLLTSPIDKQPSSEMIYKTVSHICSNFIERYRLVMIIGSNTYLNVTGLLEYVQKLNESEELFIGKASLLDEKNRLYFNDVTHYCPINPGIILSRKLLLRLCPHVNTCVEDHSKLNSVSFARCIKRFLGITCLNSPKFHDVTEKHFSDNFSNSLNSQQVKVSTSYKNSNPIIINNLHQFHLKKLINESIKQHENFLSTIDSMDKILVKEEGTTDDRLILGKKGIKNRYKHPEVIPWNRFVCKDGFYQIVHSVKDSKAIREITKHEMKVLERIEKETRLYFQKHKNFDNVNLGDIFERHIPAVGFEYLVKIKRNEKEAGNLMILWKEKNLVVTEVSVVENYPIILMLPVQENSYQQLLEFMQKFEESAINDLEKIALLLIIFPSSNSTLSPEDLNKNPKSLKTLNLLASYKHKHKKLSLKWIDARSHLYSYIGGITMATKAIQTDSLICSMTTNAEVRFLHPVRPLHLIFSS